MMMSFAIKNNERQQKKKKYSWQIHALSFLEKTQWSKVENLPHLTVVQKSKPSKDKWEKTPNKTKTKTTHLKHKPRYFHIFCQAKKLFISYSKDGSTSHENESPQIYVYSLQHCW